jgi:prepilin peptidase CpaA
MTGNLTNLAGPALLGLLLAAAIAQDVFRHRIPNAVVFPGIALGLALAALLPGGMGLADALAGLGIGLAAMLPLYFTRALGAGDVKLMAMAGAFLGLHGAIGAVLFTWLAGMLLGLLFALRAGVLTKTAHNLRVMVHAFGATLAATEGPSFDPRADSAARFPYSVAIGLGSAAFLVLKHLPQ